MSKTIKLITILKNIPWLQEAEQISTGFYMLDQTMGLPGLLMTQQANLKTLGTVTFFLYVCLNCYHAF